METDTIRSEEHDDRDNDHRDHGTEYGTDQGTGHGTAAKAGQLRRPLHNRMLAGVAGGVADYFGIDATIVRIGFVVLTFLGGTGIPLYLAGLLLIPEEGADQSLASSLIQSIQSR